MWVKTLPSAHPHHWSTHSRHSPTLPAGLSPQEQGWGTLSCLSPVPCMTSGQRDLMEAAPSTLNSTKLSSTSLSPSLTPLTLTVLQQSG